MRLRMTRTATNAKVIICTQSCAERERRGTFQVPAEEFRRLETAAPFQGTPTFL